MSIHYSDYLWKNGSPYGVKPATNETITYKIISDPYRKALSVEEYHERHFSRVIYDSRLFDFRKLKPEVQTAWEKEQISETEALIRDQDDRLVLIEQYCFEGDLCRECRALSPQATVLSIQQLFYIKLGDAFNGAILFDINNKPIVVKTYEFDDEANHFTTLLKEEWNPITKGGRQSLLIKNPS